MRYIRKSDIKKCTQFNWVGQIDSKETCDLARSLGVSRNGDGAISLLWEIKTNRGWRLVENGDYIIDLNSGDKEIIPKSNFEDFYIPLDYY